MNVTLSPEAENYVKEQVRMGFYRDESEVITHGLLLLHGRDELDGIDLDALRQSLAESIAQADRGELIEFTPGVVEDIRRRGRARLEAERAVKG